MAENNECFEVPCNDWTMIPSPRFTWDDVWIEIAYAIARRSLCVRDQVGSVIVANNNRIVSVGYNNPPAGFDHHDKRCDSWCERTMVGAKCAGYTDCPSLHAEANALSVCDRSQREFGTIYVTSVPCHGCAKLIANSGLQKVVWVHSEESERRIATDGSKAIDLLNECGIETVRYVQ